VADRREIEVEDDKIIDLVTMDTSQRLTTPLKQQVLFDSDILNVIPNPIIEVQEWIINNKPYLINRLQKIDDNIRKKYIEIITGNEFGI
jgi:hypothetical protein